MPSSSHPLPQRTEPDSAHVRLPADKRREQLIQVAVDLFSRKGFNGTTTREIAAAAGVTEAIIFRHFQTKEQLYAAIIDRRVNTPDTAEWIADTRSAMDRDDDEAVIRLLISVIIRMPKTDPKFERLMQYAALEGNEMALMYIRQITASIVDAFRTYFSRRQKQGALCPIGPDAALMAIVGMAKHYAFSRYVYGLKEHCMTDDQALENFTQVAMSGLCVKPQRAGDTPRSKQ